MMVVCELEAKKEKNKKRLNQLMSPMKMCKMIKKDRIDNFNT